MYKHVRITDNKVVSTQLSARFIPSLTVILSTKQEKELLDNGINLPPLFHVTDAEVNNDDELKDGKFIAPEIIIKPVDTITPAAMRDRFTFEERVLIDNSIVPEVVTFRTDLALRVKPVRLNSPRFGMAMALLLSKDLIEAGREITLLENGTADEAV